MSIENLKTIDPFAEADEDTGEVIKASQQYIHIRVQQRNGRKSLTTVQGIPKKFDQKKILKHLKKDFSCNGTVVQDSEMGEVIQLQGDQRQKMVEFLTNPVTPAKKEDLKEGEEPKKAGLGLDPKTVKKHGF